MSTDTKASAASRARRASRLSEGAAPRPLDYQLSYPGKLAEAEVLSGPRAMVEKRLSVGLSQDTTWRNRLYWAENLNVLRTLRDDPEVCGRVVLVYIDPPFASGALFETRAASFVLGKRWHLSSPAGRLSHQCTFLSCVG